MDNKIVDIYEVVERYASGQMKCKFQTKAKFMGFGVDTIKSDCGLVTQTVAIVQFKSGNMRLVPVNLVIFNGYEPKQTYTF